MILSEPSSMMLKRHVGYCTLLFLYLCRERRSFIFAELFILFGVAYLDCGGGCTIARDEFVVNVGFQCSPFAASRLPVNWLLYFHAATLSPGIA